MTDHRIESVAHRLGIWKGSHIDRSLLPADLALLGPSQRWGPRVSFDQLEFNGSPNARPSDLAVSACCCGAKGLASHSEAQTNVNGGEKCPVETGQRRAPLVHPCLPGFVDLGTWAKSLGEVFASLVTTRSRVGRCQRHEPDECFDR